MGYITTFGSKKSGIGGRGYGFCEATVIMPARNSALANVVSCEYTIASKEHRTLVRHVPYFCKRQSVGLRGALYYIKLHKGGLQHERRRESNCDTAFAFDIKCL